MAEGRATWRSVASAAHRRLNRIADPVDRAHATLDEMDALTKELEALSAIRLQAVAELRQQGLTMEAIAKRLGVSKQRASQLVNDAQRLPAPSPKSR